jgi:hypothetical protein
MAVNGLIQEQHNTSPAVVQRQTEKTSAVKVASMDVMRGAWSVLPSSGARQAARTRRMVFMGAVLGRIVGNR